MSVKFKDYVKFTDKMSVYRDAGNKDGFACYSFPALVGEVGELASVIAKHWRDDYDSTGKPIAFPIQFTKQLVYELGDIAFLWVRCCVDLGHDPKDILEINMGKLQDRKDRGVIQGSGDNR